VNDNDVQYALPFGKFVIQHGNVFKLVEAALDCGQRLPDITRVIEAYHERQGVTMQDQSPDSHLSHFAERCGDVGLSQRLRLIMQS